jgi:hypothetical protein
LSSQILSLFFLALFSACLKIVSVAFSTTEPAPRNSELERPSALSSYPDLDSTPSNRKKKPFSPQTRTARPQAPAPLGLNPHRQSASGRQHLARRSLGSSSGWGLAVTSGDQTGAVVTVALPSVDFKAFPPFTLKDVTCGWVRRVCTL